MMPVSCRINRTSNPPTSSVKLWVSITRTAIRRSTIQWSVWRSHSPTVTRWSMAMETSVLWMVMELRQCVTPKHVCPRFPWNCSRTSKRKRSTGAITTMPDIVNRLFYQAASLTFWSTVPWVSLSVWQPICRPTIWVKRSTASSPTWKIRISPQRN